MGLFDDINDFLETRLEEFLRNNPHLEFQALQEQLKEQRQDTLKLIQDLETERQVLEQKILDLGQEIKTWHFRIDKAKNAGREDLAVAAQEREATLLRQGNQLWGQMEGVKERLSQAKDLLTQIKQRQQEMEEQAVQFKTPTNVNSVSSNWDTIGWNQGTNNTSRPAVDPLELEREFQKIELNDELDKLKQNM